jgi:FkbM family methyltransferase
MRHHPIFDAVEAYVGARADGHTLDYVGAQFQCKWGALSHLPASSRFEVPRPVFDEEYFEFVDVLESVRDASDAYVMMELGAGFGRWGIRAGLAARRRGIRDIKLLFVEGLPKHVRWLNEALALNDLASVSTVVPKAIAYSGGPVEFMVESTHDGSDWFGQGIAFPGAGSVGYRTQLVESTTFEVIAASYDQIDLVDMDLQQAERELVANSMETLNAKVKRVHIGTHLPDIEDELRIAFEHAGWQKIWDFGCSRENDTPFGAIRFVDGVQGWINPRLR